MGLSSQLCPGFERTLVLECSVSAQFFLCFGSSPRLKGHLGTLLLPELLPPWECKDEPYQGWLCLFVCFSGASFKQLLDHRVKETS